MSMGYEGGARADVEAAEDSVFHRGAAEDGEDSRTWQPSSLRKHAQPQSREWPGDV